MQNIDSSYSLFVRVRALGVRVGFLGVNLNFSYLISVACKYKWQTSLETKLVL